MKIRGLPGEADQEALKILKKDHAPKSARSGVAHPDTGVEKMNDSDDTVQIGLSRSIQQILDPQQMDAARRTKVEELKKKVEEGTYIMPSSAELAQAVGQELTFEIVANGASFSNNSGGGSGEDSGT